MTKTEQTRLQAWRFKVLQQAADGPHLPAFRDFPPGLLPVEATARGLRRSGSLGPTPGATSVAPSISAAGGRQQDRLPPAALPLRAG